MDCNLHQSLNAHLNIPLSYIQYLSSHMYDIQKYTETALKPWYTLLKIAILSSFQHASLLAWYSQYPLD